MVDWLLAIWAGRFCHCLRGSVFHTFRLSLELRRLSGRVRRLPRHAWLSERFIDDARDARTLRRASTPPAPPEVVQGINPGQPLQPQDLLLRDGLESLAHPTHGPSPAAGFSEADARSGGDHVDWARFVS